MNPSYVRIRLSRDEATSRFAAWMGCPEVTPAREVESTDAVEMSCKHGRWIGAAIFIHECEGWTIFDDLSGSLSSLPSLEWARLAGREELVFAAYNSADRYGELVVIRDSMVVREFLSYPDAPESNANVGQLEHERATRIESWVGVASFMDGDSLADAGAPTGELRLFGRA